jgi:Uncharacterized conserved protein (COG2071)
MRIPVLRGVIDRRILANFRIDAEVAARVIPQPFRPKLVNGFAMGGICLIRLKQVRPWFFPFPWGLRSENAAHRFAVEWDEGGQTREGVYIPRRNTNSRLSTIVGGTLFPGVHHHSRFDVSETVDRLSVALRSDDGRTRVHVSGRVADALPPTSVFSSLAQASEFFEHGSLGYSDTSQSGRYDGLELRCRNWSMQPLEIDRIESSFFEDLDRFPKGSAVFDHALLMRGIEHEWHGRGDLCCETRSKG